MRIVVTTTGTAEDAERLADGMVGERLAACVQIVGPVRSVYRWDGEIQHEQEWQCWIKTAADRVDALTEWIKGNHPYDVPEVVTLPVLDGNADYLSWVTTETRPG
ncbi:divalent-cation tolerance protein CutA [Actinokineospora xionganensis]|uniref:Divalent-cation tolerance protein CutA n=1 Tax=Actinokineospora xionganensis TaxID=2684470 RepID=A0ABR7LFH2_9PSEU|nr:divalent-cation tolerance protein CutA [Actinokineospora xionganensis]MBC6451440.1 divalent-cation tolerance protein CutA [Actinokineospora xionganensis]